MTYPVALRAMLQQIAAKIETTEGTPESLSASDADLLVYGVEFEPNIEKVERKPMRKYMTQLSRVVGKQFARVTFQMEVKGTTAIGTAPAYGKLLKACGMQQGVIVELPIGSITGTLFLPGELVTGGTSSAVGLVVDRTSATPLRIVVLSGTFQSGEVVTGSVSASTATTSATVVAAKGFNYRPTSDVGSSLTIGFYSDGKKRTLYGARGNVSGALKNGALGMLTFTFSGIYDTDADVAMLDPTYPAVVPVTLLDAGLYLDTATPEFDELSFDLGNEPQYVETAQSSKGARSVRIVGRDPKVTLAAYATLVADFDYLGKLASSTTSYLRCVTGSVAANRVVLAFPALSYDAVKHGAKGKLQGESVTFSAGSPDVSTGDNEVLISVY